MNRQRFTLDAMSDPVPSLAFADLLAYTDYLAKHQAGFPAEPPQGYYCQSGHEIEHARAAYV